MNIINSSLQIEKQTLSELPSHLLLPEDIDDYVTQVHELTQYLVNNPRCFILPSQINEGRIFRTDVASILTKENYYLPVLPSGSKTDPIWFTSEHPRDEYIFSGRANDWIISCIKMKDHQTKDGKNMGYIFYIDFNGEDDDDPLCSQHANYTTKLLNKPLMKRLNSILGLFYKKDKNEKTDEINMPKYGVLNANVTTIRELNASFSHESGKRNSAYEVDRYMVNKMMIIFNNVQEILQKQSANIFITDTNNEFSNNISILGYYTGNIRAIIQYSNNGCDSMTPEVVVQSKYIDKDAINEYFYPRDPSNADCRADIFMLDKATMLPLGGKKNNKNTKKRRNTRKRKIRATKYKRNRYRMPEIWFEIGKKREGVFNAREYWNYYYKEGGREKFLQFHHEKDLKEIREFIEENKDNKKALEEGYKTYYFHTNMYKTLLQEFGLTVDPPPKPESK